MAEQSWNRETPDVHEHVWVTRTADRELRTQVVEDVAAARHMALAKATQFIWLLFGVLEGLIALRIALKLIAANPANPFASLVYSFTDLFLWPFFGLTISPSVGNLVLEIPAIIAMMVFALVAWVIVKVIWLLFAGRTTTSVSTYEQEDLIR